MLQSKNYNVGRLFFINSINEGVFCLLDGSPYEEAAKSRIQELSISKIFSAIMIIILLPDLQNVVRVFTVSAVFECVLGVFPVSAV